MGFEERGHVAGRTFGVGLPLVEQELLVHHLGLSGEPLCESASVVVLLELVVEEDASRVLLLELTLPVVGEVLEVVEVDWLE